MKTRDELHIAFKIEIDKNGQAVAFGGTPAFLEEEIDYWLNKAINQVISNKFTGNNTLRSPFESNAKRISDLQNLVKSQNITLSFINSNQLSGQLPSDYMFFVSGLLNFDKQQTVIALDNHSNVSNLKDAYNNHPYIERPIAITQSNQISLFIDLHTMIADEYSLDIDYLRIPTRVEDYPTKGTDEIPDYMWYEIIDRAVVLALDDIESQRVQTKSQLTQVNE